MRPARALMRFLSENHTLPQTKGLLPCGTALLPLSPRRPPPSHSPRTPSRPRPSPLQPTSPRPSPSPCSTSTSLWPQSRAARHQLAAKCVLGREPGCGIRREAPKFFWEMPSNGPIFLVVPPGGGGSARGPLGP